MYNLLIGGIFAAVVASTDAAELPCKDVNATVVQCMLDNGFSSADVSWLETIVTFFNPQVIQHECDHLSQYKAAFQCVVSELDRCSLEAGIFSNSSLTSTFQTWDIICNDPKFKVDCYVQVDQQPAELQACIAPHMATASVCEIIKISFQCAVDQVRKCDAHTATVVETLASLATVSECSDVIVG